MRACGNSSTRSASTTSSCPRPNATRPAGSTQTLLTVLERYDAVMEIMLPSLREERQQSYSPFLPRPPQDRHRHAGADRRAQGRCRHDRLARSRHGRALRDAGHGRARQAAMEARLGHALGGARRRLRDGRQGSHRQREAVRPDRQGARRPAAGRLQLRTVPRREGPEDFEVEGQRPDDRRMARPTGRRTASACSCTTSRARRSGCSSTSFRARWTIT